MNFRNFTEVSGLLTADATTITTTINLLNAKCILNKDILFLHPLTIFEAFLHFPSIAT